MNKHYTFLMEAFNWKQLADWMFVASGKNKKKSLQLFTAVSDILNRQGWKLENIGGGTDVMRLIRTAAAKCKAQGLEKDAAILDSAIKSYVKNSERLISRTSETMGKATEAMGAAARKAVPENAGRQSASSIRRGIEKAERDIEKAGETSNKAGMELILGREKLGDEVKGVAGNVSPKTKSGAAVAQLSGRTAAQIQDELIAKIEASNDPYEIKMLSAQLSKIASKYKVGNRLNDVAQKVRKAEEQIQSVMEKDRAAREAMAPEALANLDSARTQYTARKDLEDRIREGTPSLMDTLRSWRDKAKAKISGFFH